MSTHRHVEMPTLTPPHPTPVPTMLHARIWIGSEIRRALRGKASHKIYPRQFCVYNVVLQPALAAIPPIGTIARGTLEAHNP